MLRNLLNLTVLTHSLRVSFLDGLKDALGGQHAALHGSVRPLDLGHVHEARAAARQAAAGKGQLGYALKSTFIQCPGAIPEKTRIKRVEFTQAVSSSLLE